MSVVKLVAVTALGLAAISVGAAGVDTLAERDGRSRQDAEADTTLLAARDAIWHAWFAYDRDALERLLPPEVIAINGGDSLWYDRPGVLAASRDFRAGGGALLRLAFPRVKVQQFGNVAVIYSRYEMTYAYGSDTTVDRGRATEVFVRGPAGWTNPGWHLDLEP